MKIGVFTDSHYSEISSCAERFNNQSLRKIKEAYVFFEKENCDLVVCLGDLIDRENDHQKEIKNLKEIAEIINKSKLKTVCLMGNHDAFSFEVSEFYNFLGMEIPKTIETENETLLFLDACYFKSGKHYTPVGGDWTDTFYPFTEELKLTLENAKNNVYIFMHQNIDPNISKDHLLYNTEEINSIIANSKKVKGVYQGHFHKGAKNIINGINYIAFPAMCQNENCYFTIII